MKKGLTVLLISLIFIVVACDQLPAKQYNEDGSGAVSVTFEYPYTWEIVEDNKEGSKDVFVFQDASEIEIEEDGSLSGFFVNTVGIGITTQFYELSDVTNNLKTPLDVLKQREASADEIMQAYLEEVTDAKDLGEDKINFPHLVLLDVYEVPGAHEICDQEVVGMKSQIYNTILGLVPFQKRWEYFVTIEETPIYVVGYFGDIEEEKFEQIFESVICSLELHD